LKSILNEAIIEEFNNSFLGRCVNFLVKFKLVHSLIIDRETYKSLVYVDCLRQIPFDPTDLVHMRIVNSTFIKVTGEQMAPPLGSDKWTEFGFQNASLSTDFRSNGLLPMVLILASLK